MLLNGDTGDLRKTATLPSATFDWARGNGGPGTAQWAVGAVVEDGGFGAWAAAPIVKCIYAALADPSRLAPLSQSEPLDKTATTPTPVGPMPNSSCLAINDARARAD